LFSLPPSSEARQIPRKYDVQIKKAAGIYLPQTDWRLWKAQLWQESLLNPNAVSPVGAKGLAQFMPGTWNQVVRELGVYGVQPQDEFAIQAGAYYMAKLRKVWRSPRPEKDRHSLAMASYNAGTGNILKSQKLCGNVAEYEPIMSCLHRVTGKHAAETRGYAPKIYGHYARLLTESEL
jgi:soluble lytic murein transglycosylase-like protein